MNDICVHRRVLRSTRDVVVWERVGWIERVVSVRDTPPHSDGGLALGAVNVSTSVYWLLSLASWCRCRPG